MAATQMAVIKIGWFFREQPISDQGVDAIAEDVEISVRASSQRHEEGTGRLLAIQIKAGPSWFAEKSQAGWWFRFDLNHAQRWFNLSIPVVIVLVNTESDTCYWQEVSSRTVVEAGRGFKVEVPEAQTVASAAASWRVLASQAAAVAAARYENSLAHLPPATRKSIKSMHAESDLDAQLLAYHLAEGRHNPEGTVQSLITSEPLWVTRHAPASWATIGEYASLHGRAELAAAAFERAAAADLGPDADNLRAKYLATAAIELMDTDRPRAANLVDRAVTAGARDHVVVLLRALLDHPIGDASAISIPGSFDIDSDSVRASAFAQSVLAIRAQRRGEILAALRHSQYALTSDSENGTAVILRAEIMLWASQVGSEDAANLAADGIRLLQQALAQRHEWDGPTLDLTLRLARACLLSGQYHDALDICLPTPDGSATDSDARNPTVQRLALAAATGLGRRPMVERIGKSLGSTYADHLAKWRAGLLDAESNELRIWMQDDLDDAISQDDYVRIAQLGIALAEAGVDTAQQIEPYVRRSILPADTLSLISALVVAHNNLDDALVQLRALARTSHQAAVVLLGLFERAGRNQEALILCDSILAHRREPAVVASRAQLLIDQGDPQAEQVALDAVAELSGFPFDRRRFLTYAAGKAAERNNWELATQRLQEVIHIAGTPETGEVWRLVVAHLQTGHIDRARYIIDRHQPEVRDLTEAEYWLRAHSPTVIDAVKAAEALALAERFNHPQISTALLSLIITGTSGVDPRAESSDMDPELDERRRLALSEVPADLHVQAFEVLNRLIEEHGEATGVTVLTGEPEDLVQQTIAMLKDSAERDRVVADIIEQTQNSQLPIGFLAALTKRCYSTILVQRAIGMLPASSPYDDEHDLEVEAAAAAMNGTVIADASSLLTSCGLVEVEATSVFLSVLVAPATLRDVYRANADIRGSAASPGALSYDHTNDTPVMTTLSSDEYVRQLQRVNALTALASTLQVRSVSERSLLPDFANEPHHDPWTEPLELSRELGYALWSDDLGVRRIARQLGVSAFGTPALLTAINEHRLNRSQGDQVRQLVEAAARQVRALAADRIVDLRLDYGDVVLLAEAESWMPVSGALVLSRPSWWAWNQFRFEELASLFSAVKAEQPDYLLDWEGFAMTGAARAFLDPTTRSRILCMIAFLGRDRADLTSSFQAGFERARLVATRLGLADPIAELPRVIELLRRNVTVGDIEALLAELEALVES